MRPPAASPEPVAVPVRGATPRTPRSAVPGPTLRIRQPRHRVGRLMPPVRMMRPWSVAASCSQLVRATGPDVTIARPDGYRTFVSGLTAALGADRHHL